MLDFGVKLNNDLFGCIAHVQTGSAEQLYQYKIIGMMKSNYYCDVPLKLNISPQPHDEAVDVLCLVHCGFLNDTTTVHKVALKDCTKIENPMVQKIVEKLEEHGFEEIEKVIEMIEGEEGVV